MQRNIENTVVITNCSDIPPLYPVATNIGFSRCNILEDVDAASQALTARQT
jgi:hypothetical protein